jgi:hypothetical protein
VVRDPQTLKSKGYGFVSFVKKAVSWKLLSVLRLLRPYRAPFVSLIILKVTFMFFISNQLTKSMEQSHS